MGLGGRVPPLPRDAMGTGIPVTVPRIALARGVGRSGREPLSQEKMLSVKRAAPRVLEICANGREL